MPFALFPLDRSVSGRMDRALGEPSGHGPYLPALARLTQLCRGAQKYLAPFAETKAPALPNSPLLLPYAPHLLPHAPYTPRLQPYPSNLQPHAPRLQPYPPRLAPCAPMQVLFMTDGKPSDPVDARVLPGELAEALRVLHEACPKVSV